MPESGWPACRPLVDLASLSRLSGRRSRIHERDKKISRFLAELARDAVPRRRSRRRSARPTTCCAVICRWPASSTRSRQTRRAEIVAMLAERGSNFDVASRGEIDAVPRPTAPHADRLSFGNTIKKESDIAFAYEAGVRLFAFDSEARARKAGARGARRPRVLPHPRLLRRGRVAAVAQIRLQPGNGRRLAVQGARARARPLWGVVPRRIAADRSRPVGRRDRRGGADVLGCSPRPTSICAWSISAAASRRNIAARCRGSSIMPRR